MGHSFKQNSIKSSLGRRVSEPILKFVWDFLDLLLPSQKARPNSQRKSSDFFA